MGSRRCLTSELKYSIPGIMVDRLIRFRTPLLIGCVLVTAIGISALIRPGLRQDYRLEAFVGSDDPAYRTFRAFLEEFTSNEVAVIAIHSDDALSAETQTIVKQLVAQCRPISSVQRVVALSEIPAPLRALLGDSLYDHPMIRGNLLSQDGRTTAIVLQMSAEHQDAAERQRSVQRLRDIVDRARERAPSTMRFVLAGPYVTLIDMYDYVDRDLRIFTVASFVLMGATLWIVFRRLGPMIYALTVAIAAVTSGLGLAVLAGFVTSLITQMIVVLIAVLSVATCVHLCVAADEVADENLPPKPRHRHAGDSIDGSARSDPDTLLHRIVLQRMLAPCTAVVVTTAAGFASVCISSIMPVRRFGILMVCGLLLSLIYGLVGVVFLPSPRKSHASTQRLGRFLASFAAAALPHRRIIYVATILLVVVAAAGIPRLRFESDFIKSFRANTGVRRSYEFIQQHLSPVGSVEVVVRSSASPTGRHTITAQQIHQAREFGEGIVERFPSIRKALSLADLISIGGSPLPHSNTGLAIRLAAARLMFGADAVRGFINDDGTALRLNLRAVEGVPVEEKLRINSEIKALAEAHFGPDVSVQVTGLYHFYAVLVSGLVRDQYRSFAVALPAVFVVLALMLRSIKLAAVAMIPNLLPLVWCIGGMAWAGIPVSMTTAMMLSVVLGIAVDDTVHYVWRFRRELRLCGDYHEAALRTHASVGRACVFTTVVIAGGFWILTLSQFLPTAYFGGLVGFTMLGTLAADLLVLPALLQSLKPFGASPDKSYHSPVTGGG